MVFRWGEARGWLRELGGALLWWGAMMLQRPPSSASLLRTHWPTHFRGRGGAATLRSRQQADTPAGHQSTGAFAVSRIEEDEAQDSGRDSIASPLVCDWPDSAACSRPAIGLLQAQKIT